MIFYVYIYIYNAYVPMLSLISPRGQDGSPKSSAGASQGRTEDDGHMKVVGAIRHWTLRIG